MNVVRASSISVVVAIVVACGGSAQPASSQSPEATGGWKSITRNTAGMLGECGYSVPQDWEAPDQGTTFSPGREIRASVSAPKLPSDSSTGFQKWDQTKERTKTTFQPKQIIADNATLLWMDVPDTGLRYVLVGLGDGGRYFCQLNVEILQAHVAKDTALAKQVAQTFVSKPAVIVPDADALAGVGWKTVTYDIAHQTCNYQVPRDWTPDQSQQGVSSFGGPRETGIAQAAATLGYFQLPTATWDQAKAAVKKASPPSNVLQDDATVLFYEHDAKTTGRGMHYLLARPSTDKKYYCQLLVDVNYDPHVSAWTPVVKRIADSLSAK